MYIYIYICIYIYIYIYIYICILNCATAGFPLWDEAVHDVLHSAWLELVPIFCAYCKLGGADQAI